MPSFKSKQNYYRDFLIPMITNCITHIKNNGKVCINISPSMYVDLIKYGMRSCDEELDLLQQKRLGKNKEDKIYIWNSKYLVRINE